jgi:GT2 family glycosyltransferase
MGPAHVEAAAVLSTVNIAMPWKVWDKVGPFIEPGGPGGSEDVDWCRRATKLGYGFAVTDPHCVIHTGLVSSSGKQIVGYEQMVEQNKRLQELYGIKELRTV